MSYIYIMKTTAQENVRTDVAASAEQPEAPKGCGFVGPHLSITACITTGQKTGIFLPQFMAF